MTTVKLSLASDVKGMDSTTGHSGRMSTELLYVTCCSSQGTDVSMIRGVNWLTATVKLSLARDVKGMHSTTGHSGRCPPSCCM